MTASVNTLSDEDKNRLIAMAWLLNNLTSDFRTPVDIFVQLRPVMDSSQQNFMAFSRLCLSSLIINLCKFNEIIDHYGFEIKTYFPEDLRNSIYSVKSEIEKRGMYAYRSKYIAHAFTKESGQKAKPLSFEENVNSLMKVIDYGLPVKENVFKFGDWVYKKDDENSVVYINYKAVQRIESLVGGLGKRT